jgi:hypothetical protein
MADRDHTTTPAPTPTATTQLERLRGMTPTERYRAARALYWSARRLKEAALRAQHPEWTQTSSSARCGTRFCMPETKWALVWPNATR